jgi:Lon protease-like protein
MEQPLLPLFPLQVVLFPRTMLPLHIFEDRYKEMMSDVMGSNSEFGIVLAGDKGIASTGCSATVQKVIERYPDGRLDLLTIGRRRFEIQSLDGEKTYLRGHVDFFDDEDMLPVPEEIKARAVGGYQALSAVASETFEPEMTDPQLSFQLAQIVSDLGFRQNLLSLRSEAGRMKQLVDFLPSYTSRQRDIEHIKSVAPKNGHGKWPQNV